MSLQAIKHAQDAPGSAAMRFRVRAILVSGPLFASAIGLASVPVHSEPAAEAVHEVRCDSADVVIRTPRPADIPLASDGARMAAALRGRQGAGRITPGRGRRLPGITACRESDGLLFRTIVLKFAPWDSQD